MSQSVTSCYNNSTLYTVVFKTVLTGYYRNFIYDSIFYEILFHIKDYDNSEPAFGSSQI